MQAMNRIGPRQQEHFRTSTRKTRFSNKAPSRRYVDGTDVDFGDAAGDAASNDGDGDVGDTCGAAGGFCAINGRCWAGNDLIAQMTGQREDTMPCIDSSPGGDESRQVRVRRPNHGHELLEQLEAGHQQLPAAVLERAFHIDTHERVDHRYW